MDRPRSARTVPDAKESAVPTDAAIDPVAAQVAELLRTPRRAPSQAGGLTASFNGLAVEATRLLADDGRERPADDPRALILALAASMQELGLRADRQDTELTACRVEIDELRRRLGRAEHWLGG
jgi:hypothetical protein